MSEGKEFGPWSVAQMRAWHQKGFFVYNDAPLRQEGEDAFVPFSLRKEVPNFVQPDPKAPTKPAAATTTTTTSSSSTTTASTSTASSTSTGAASTRGLCLLLCC